MKNWKLHLNGFLKKLVVAPNRCDVTSCISPSWIERKRVDQLIIFAIFISFVFCFGAFICYSYFYLVVSVESFQS